MNAKQARWRRVMRALGSAVRPGRLEWQHEPGTSTVIVRGPGKQRSHRPRTGGRDRSGRGEPAPPPDAPGPARAKAGTCR